MRAYYLTPGHTKKYTLYLSYLLSFWLFSCGIPIGPCTTHPISAFSSFGLGLIPSPQLLLRGHRHLGPMGCTMVSPSFSLECVLPSGGKKNCTYHMHCVCSISLSVLRTPSNSSLSLKKKKPLAFDCSAHFSFHSEWFPLSLPSCRRPSLSSPKIPPPCTIDSPPTIVYHCQTESA